MKISGSYPIDAPREQVWAALNDMHVLARIVPGCERLEQTAENEFEGTVKIGIQAIKGAYQGRIRLEDIQPPHHYKLVARGKSANGVIDGSGTLDLVEQGDKTILNYSGDAQIGGVLASVGQRLIEGASKQLINQSLKALVEQINARANPVPEPAPAPPPAPSVEPPPPLPSPTTTEVPERQAVVVPEHEQLKPESIVSGIINDLIADRPWMPWVIVAFLLGLVIGLSRRKG